MLDLDVGNLDAPVVRALVENSLDVGIEPVALREHVVELVLAQDRTQCRLRQLAGRFEHVGDTDDGFLGVDDTEVDDRIHPHRHIVP